MSVANGVLTMCRRGESCLERRCWSEPALCCYSGGQNDRCVVVVFVGQKQHFAALLYCCVGRHNKLCVVLLLFCLCCVVVQLCWWAQRALGDDDKRRRFRDQVHSHRAASQRDAGSVLHLVSSQVICVGNISNEVFFSGGESPSCLLGLCVR